MTDLASLPPAVDVSGLTKTYRGPHRAPVHALRGLTFQVPAGIVFGMLGPNGAGKSTTTKILTTLSRPSGGSARIDGIDVVAKPAEVRRHIGYVSQGASTDPLLTGTENLTLAGRLRGMNALDARRRASALLAEFDDSVRFVGAMLFGSGARAALTQYSDLDLVFYTREAAVNLEEGYQLCYRKARLISLSIVSLEEALSGLTRAEEALFTV